MGPTRLCRCPLKADSQSGGSSAGYAVPRGHGWGPQPWALGESLGCGGPSSLTMKTWALALPLWAQSHPESSQCLSLRQRQGEKDSFLPCHRHLCCADKVNSAPYLHVNRSTPTSRRMSTSLRYVCVPHGPPVVYRVTSHLGSPPPRIGTSALAAHKHRTRTALHSGQRTGI